MSIQSLNDNELVQLYIGGNEDSLSVLLQRHKRKIFSSIIVVVKDQQLAEDVFQDTFFKVIQTLKRGQYNEEGKFLPWISRIAHNLAIDHFRKEKRYPEIILEDGSPLLNSMQFAEESIEDKQIMKDTATRLRELIKELPEEQKQVLIMRHYLKMSFQEIAERTGVSINTALGRMRYALINLRKKMIKNHLAYDKNFYPKRSDEVPIPRNNGAGGAGNQ